MMTLSDNGLEESRRFAEGLVTAGRLEPQAFERVMRWQTERAEGVPRIISSLGLMPERDLAQSLSDYMNVPTVTPDDMANITPTDMEMSAAFLRTAQILPLDETDDGITLAMADPLDYFARRAIETKSGKAVHIKVAVASELDRALDRFLADGESQLQSIAEGYEDNADPSSEDAERLRDIASEAPVIRLVNLIIRRAAEARASDIHVEPGENRLRVRYRIDGVLQDVESPPVGLSAALLSRIKIMARLNIAERRLPQDGRIKTVVQGKEMDVRVSTVPTMYGESAVLRLLDQAQGVYQFEDLGISPGNENAILDLIDRPNGIVLVTGPTGSGKTTTLYAALKHLNLPERKIITVEDPVEYELDGINQIQVKPQIGLDFAHVLRSVLRQDPDIIMIGEIRDLETARIAVQASLTGHLVLSTVHTNGTAATITRLIDMGVEDYLLTSTVSGVIAQRLVRRLCPDCRQHHPQNATLKSRFDVDPSEAGADFWQAVGCPACLGTGYRGRVGVTEVMTLTEDIRTRILSRAGQAEILTAATGMTTMFKDGLSKTLAGVTTLDEVLRVTREA